jgi:hypothetical protein
MHTHYHIIISAYNLWCNIFPVPIILDIYTQYFFQISPLPGDRLGMVSTTPPPPCRVQRFYTLQISSYVSFILSHCSRTSFLIFKHLSFFFITVKKSITFSFPNCQNCPQENCTKLYKLQNKI